MNRMKPDHASTMIFDARHLKCPISVLAARKFLSRVAAGAAVEVISDDRASLAGFQALCRDRHHHLIGFKDRGDAFTLTILRRDTV